MVTHQHKIIGHRGAAGHTPENTLAAFDKALALNCRFIEFDVMLSLDGEAFVFHDQTLSRTTNGEGEFGLMSAEYLRSLDAGSWFSDTFREEKIPTLREAIDWLVTYDVHANIEIKPYKDSMEQTTLAVLTHLEAYWPADKVLPLVSSFDMDALRLCRLKAPHLPLGLLLHHWRKDWLAVAKELACFSVHLNQHIATEKRVKMIKEQGYHVYVYTVNSKRQAEKLWDWGVDAVFSDNLIL